MTSVLLNFGSMNEADVREEFIAPLIAELGYRSGNESNASREVTLSIRYPRSSLGRKNPKTDPYLRGRADYILEVSGYARWVIEVKGPGEALDEDAIEQAWSYANHGEVRAVYFALSNGREFQVYRTAAPPGSPPILQLTYEDILRDATPITRLLAPDAIKSAFPLTHEVGEPLGPGLRSLAMIIGGSIDYTKISVDIPILKELQISIVDGAIERGQHGNLIAYVVTVAPIKSLQQTIDRMGLSKLEYISESTTLSSDPREPTEFVYVGHAVFEKGDKLFDVMSNEWVTLPVTLRCDVHSLAKVHIENGKITGTIQNNVKYSGGANSTTYMEGNISIRVL